MVSVQDGGRLQGSLNSKPSVTSLTLLRRRASDPAERESLFDAVADTLELLRDRGDMLVVDFDQGPIGSDHEILGTVVSIAHRERARMARR